MLSHMYLNEFRQEGSAQDKRFEPTPRGVPLGRAPDRYLDPGAPIQDLAQADSIRQGIGPVDDLPHALNRLLQREGENSIAEVQQRIGAGWADVDRHIRRTDPQFLLGAPELLHPLKATPRLDPDLFRRRAGRDPLLLCTR